jgi:HlyD family secretion protein
MKIRILILLGFIVLASCAQKNEQSDGFGNFEADEVIVSSEATGQLMEFKISEGDEKKAGEIIGVVDTIPLILQKNQLIAQRELIKSKFENIKSQIDVLNEQKANLLVDRNRIEKLLEDKAATGKQKDDIKGGISVIEKQIKQIETQNININNELKALETQIISVNDKIQRCYIKNPVSGSIINKFTEKGEIVSIGKPLYKVANLENINFKAFLSGPQVANIKNGQTVKIFIDKDAKTNREVTGTIYWVSPKAEFTPKIIQTKEERVNLVYPVKIKVKNDGTLKIGMPGEIKL